MLVAERPQGSFTRQLQLGDTVDSENVQATYATGLHLSLPTRRLPSRAGFKCRPRGSERQSRRGRDGGIGEPSGESTQAIRREKVTLL